MALYFDGYRWGYLRGTYDYKAQADALLTTMRHRERRSGQTRFGARTVGPEIDDERRR